MTSRLLLAAGLVVVAGCTAGSRPGLAPTSSAVVPPASPALANSTRRAILAHLADGAATVNELAEPFALTLPAISKHIKVLERAGLVVRAQRAQYRPCALDPAPLEEISTWAEQYRAVWEASLDRMDDYLAQLQTKERPTR